MLINSAAQDTIYCTYRAANKIKIEDSCIYFWAYIDKDEILFGDNRSKNMKRLYIHIH